MGLRNMLLITGDPPKMGPYPDATAVFDIDSIGLTNLVQQPESRARSRRQPDRRADAVRDRRRREPGAPIDPTHELKRFEWKVEAGAEYAITQPVFDVAQLETLPRRRSGTCAFRSSPASGRWCRCATPSSSRTRCRASSCRTSVIARMRRANEKSKEHAVAEGIAIAREMLTALSGRRAGRAGVGAVREGGAGAAGGSGDVGLGFSRTPTTPLRRSTRSWSMARLCARSRSARSSALPSLWTSNLLQPSQFELPTFHPAVPVHHDR